MTRQSGLPEPPPVGTLALPEGTYAGTCVFITGGGTGLGKAIAVSLQGWGPTWSSPVGRPNTLMRAESQLMHSGLVCSG